MTLNRWMPGLFERFLNSGGGGENRSVSAETAQTPPEGE
jgi:hypothetical protein